jgi:hypothetical protein
VDKAKFFVFDPLTGKKEERELLDLEVDLFKKSLLFFPC